MSMRALEEFTSELPYALAEQVEGYARSVRDATDDICRDAGVEASPSIREQMMWVAALRRLHAIIGSAYWTVDTSNLLLRRQDWETTSVGATDYSEGSSMYATLSGLQRDLHLLVQELGAGQLLSLPWSEVAQVLADERRRS